MKKILNQSQVSIRPGDAVVFESDGTLRKAKREESSFIMSHIDPSELIAIRTPYTVPPGYTVVELHLR